MNTFALEVVTPSRLVYSDIVESVIVPTPNGATGVLPRHEPLFCLLSEGEIKIAAPKQEVFLAIGGGFMEVAGNSVQILVSRAFHADELNISEIKKAQEAAREILAKKGEEHERQEAYAILRRSMLEMKVVTRRTKRYQSNTGSIAS